MVDNLFSPLGGAERFAVGLATHLPRDRFEVRTLTTRNVDPSVVKTLAEAGVPHANLGRSAKHDVHRLAGLARILHRHDIDVLHAHMFGSNVWGSLIGTACRVPAIVAHEHTWSYEGRPLRKFLDGRVVGRLVDRFVAVSEADRERMVRLERVPFDKTIVIPAAYVPRRSGACGDIRHDLGLEEGTPVVGTAVMMRPQKALDVLIDAFAKLLVEVPDAHLVLAGEGPTRPSVEQRVEELGLCGQVSFLGLRHDVVELLAAMDVAVLSSDFEGTPLLAFECMASRTPLVATDVGGLSEVVEDGVTGVLVPRRDPAALATAIAALLKDPERRARLGEAASARLPAYSIDAVTRRFAALYEELMVP